MAMPVRSVSREIPEALKELPYEILTTAGLTVHDRVRFVALSGSLGPKGGFQTDSDIDLSLLVNGDVLHSLRAVCLRGFLCFGLHRNLKAFHGLVPDMRLSIETVCPVAIAWSSCGRPRHL